MLLPDKYTPASYDSFQESTSIGYMENFQHLTAIDMEHVPHVGY